VLNLTIVCADIGSVARGNFGWSSSAGKQGTTPSGLAEFVSNELNDHRPVALGFECPLFVPLMQDERFLTNARPGEGSRPWCAGAGCGALATGIVQVAWVLKAIRLALKTEKSGYLEWEQFSAAKSGLFIWEAFVTGMAKQESHIDDAAHAVKAFAKALPYPMDINAVICNSETHSLVGAAMLRTGWSSNINILSSSCLVVRPPANTAV